MKMQRKLALSVLVGLTLVSATAVANGCLQGT